MKIYLIIVSSLFLLGAGCSKYAPVDANTNTLGPGTVCIKAGGIWRQFNNACGDSCTLQRNPDTLCAQVIMDNCDCGADKCWNGHSCEAN